MRHGDPPVECRDPGHGRRRRIALHDDDVRTTIPVLDGKAGGRDAIWSGARSSGGSKAKSCQFTPAANASVTANVQ